MNLIEIAQALRQDVARLQFSPPVTHVYNPLDYAWEMHADYLKRFGRGRGKVLLLGMNPGPWGMAQTGVPFGEVSATRDWLKIDRPIRRPEVEHPKRPILGLECRRSEVSGRRLWGWAGEHFGTPRAFFSRFFVANYCPLVFLEESGKNRTPNQLRTAERGPLLAACDEALVRTVECLRPSHVIGIGQFAESRAREALRETNVTFGRILHPSPASPQANRGWSRQAIEQLVGYGICGSSLQPE
jgi:single-strand selective monofunctional uracil DNA glycosylase